MISVLMVEDDAAQVELIRAQSEHDKLVVTFDWAKSAEAALTLLRSNSQRARPDLLLIDLNLPGMSGLELLSVLAGDATLGTIPAVALSSMEPTRAVQVELKRYARAWVEKPLTLSAWAKIIKAVPSLGFSIVKLPEPAPVG